MSTNTIQKYRSQIADLLNNREAGEQNVLSAEQRMVGVIYNAAKANALKITVSSDETETVEAFNVTRLVETFDATNDSDETKKKTARKYVALIADTLFVPISDVDPETGEKLVGDDLARVNSRNNSRKRVVAQALQDCAMIARAAKVYPVKGWSAQPVINKHGMIEVPMRWLLGKSIEAGKGNLITDDSELAMGTPLDGQGRGVSKWYQPKGSDQWRKAPTSVMASMAQFRKLFKADAENKESGSTVTAAENRFSVMAAQARGFSLASEDMKNIATKDVVALLEHVKDMIQAQEPGDLTKSLRERVITVARQLEKACDASADAEAENKKQNAA